MANCFPLRSMVNLRSWPGVPPSMFQTCPRVEPNRDAVDCDQMVAWLDAVRPRRYRRLAFEIGDAQDGESAVVLGAQDESDDIEVWEVERASEFEVDRRVSVVESDPVVEQSVRTDQSGGWDGGALREVVHPVFGKVDNYHVREE